MTLLIVGCGYVGRHVAHSYARQFAGAGGVYALTRSAERTDEFEALGITAVVGDWLTAKLSLPPADHVLISVPHRPVDDLGEATHIQGLKNVIDAMKDSASAKPQKIVYLSTTGVYGECESDIVDEDTPVTPTRIGPSIAVAAENWLDTQAAALTDTQITTLRLAGIYGPGRVPLAAKLRGGEALAVPRQGHLNLIHVDDIAAVICHIFLRSMQRRLYVLSDGQPVIRETFYRELARLCGIESPQFCEPDESDNRARRATDKRVNPQRIVSELSYEFKLPDYNAGLRNSLVLQP
jgi:nucleoside-diphosphate-sugar epimerase